MSIAWKRRIAIVLAGLLLGSMVGGIFVLRQETFLWVSQITVGLVALGTGLFLGRLQRWMETGNKYTPDVRHLVQIGFILIGLGFACQGLAALAGLSPMSRLILFAVLGGCGALIMVAALVKYAAK